jgi:hypothetical protein
VFIHLGAARPQNNLYKFVKIWWVILGTLFVSVIVASLSLSLYTGGDGLNWLMSFEVNLRGKLFQDTKFWICFNLLFRRVALLQIL